MVDGARFFDLREGDQGGQENCRWHRFPPHSFSFLVDSGIVHEGEQDPEDCS